MVLLSTWSTQTHSIDVASQFHGRGHGTPGNRQDRSIARGSQTLATTVAGPSIGQNVSFGRRASYLIFFRERKEKLDKQQPHQLVNA